MGDEGGEQPGELTGELTGEITGEDGAVRGRIEDRECGDWGLAVDVAMGRQFAEAGDWGFDATGLGDLTTEECEELFEY